MEENRERPCSYDENFIKKNKTIHFNVLLSFESNCNNVFQLPANKNKQEEFDDFAHPHPPNPAACCKQKGKRVNSQHHFHFLSLPLTIKAEKPSFF
ncbi:hypothetical protein glysoja_028613 [Glycine soja]|uniref:Uncharacterized protein n=1 Tax=Glycine soja TaxID=3848 RepID=A0A0B2PYK0_GLYSO|nr:hypothetical protein glysoja_028613 [Glycine soja]